MNITGKTMIFKSEYGYSTAISNKNQEGKYDKMYVSVLLKKVIEIENKTIIEVTKVFISFYNTKEGLPKIKLVIQDFVCENNDIEPLDNSELPF